MPQHLGAYEQVSFRSETAAVFYPRVRVPDPTIEFRLRTIGASGTMAGVWARTDTARGVWKAPAGIGTGRVHAAEYDAGIRVNHLHVGQA